MSGSQKEKQARNEAERELRRRDPKTNTHTASRLSWTHTEEEDVTNGAQLLQCKKERTRVAGRERPAGRGQRDHIQS